MATNRNNLLTQYNSLCNRLFKLCFNNRHTALNRKAIDKTAAQMRYLEKQGIGLIGEKNAVQN